MSAPAYELFGPLDAVLGGTSTIEYVLLGLLLANMVTRVFAHRRNVTEAAGGDVLRIRPLIPGLADEAPGDLTRHPAHVLTNLTLLLASFYYTTLHQHSGIVFTTLVLGVFITDFFEFESRCVDFRRDLDIEPPKGAIAASLLALLYVGYLSLFQFIAPVWSAVV